MYEKLKGKRLLVLGGTIFSCEIIKKAKEMGLVVAVVDYYPREKSPGKQIADEAYDVSTTDVDAVVELIKKKKIDGIITGFSDMLLPYYAEICLKAGLPAYATKEQFNTFIDKSKYKALCRDFNVPTVEEYFVDDTDINSCNIKYPVIVKPSDGSGSRGITICNTADELLVAIQKAKSFSKGKSVLVERYLTGREVTVFWLFVDGNYYLTAIGNRHVKKCQGNSIIALPVGYTYPATITTKYKKNIEKNVKEMLRYVGIRNGMMFMQCKVEDDECVVYDIGFRLTGSLEYLNFEKACGYNPLEMLINFAITGKMTDEDVEEKICPYTMKPSFNVSCLSKPGIIAEINGIDEVKALPYVSGVIITHYPGEEITEQMRGLLTQITVRVLGTVDDKNLLYKTMKDIEEMIHIISSNGSEMRISGIELGDVEGVVL